MGFNFEWDEDKARANIKRHGVSFDEAVAVFTDPQAITIADPDHSITEIRYIDIGMSDTERDENIRLQQPPSNRNGTETV